MRLGTLLLSRESLGAVTRGTIQSIIFLLSLSETLSLCQTGGPDGGLTEVKPWRWTPEAADSILPPLRILAR